METKKSFGYIRKTMALVILSSPLTALSPVEALPAGVPGERCGTISNPQPGTLCHTVTPGGGKVNARGSEKAFPSIIIQATEPEYVIADVVLEITSDAGDRNLPSVNQLSPGGQASIVSVAKDKLRELKQIRGELQTKATVLAGPALIEAQTKLSALQEQERIYENVVTTTTTAGQDAGKFQVAGASARSRSCGFANTDTCGSWVEYNVYAVKRYVGNPIVAYNRAFAVAEDARNTINRLAAQPPVPPPQPNPPPSPPVVKPASGVSVKSVGITAGVPETLVTKPGNEFLSSTFSFKYNGGPAILSANPDGTGSTRVDNLIEISVVHPDGTKATFKHDHGSGCIRLTFLPPMDISPFFAMGDNQVSVKLSELCGSGYSSTPIWLNTK
jgi:hypothetical protein